MDPSPPASGCSFLGPRPASAPKGQTEGQEHWTPPKAAAEMNTTGWGQQSGRGGLRLHPQTHGHSRPGGAEREADSQPRRAGRRPRALGPSGEGYSHLEDLPHPPLNHRPCHRGAPLPTPKRRGPMAPASIRLLRPSPWHAAVEMAPTGQRRAAPQSPRTRVPELALTGQRVSETRRFDAGKSVQPSNLLLQEPRSFSRELSKGVKIMEQPDSGVSSM